MISSKLILSSRNAAIGDTICTFVLRYPRIILAEVNTHRMFSRNTSSSRAVPASTMRRRVIADPFIPSHIGANQKGMAAGEELTGWRRKAVQALYEVPLYVSLLSNWAMEKLGAHKQIGNRLLEPWMYVEQVVTATSWENFFAQRDHPAAEPHFGELAAQMHEQYRNMQPQTLQPGEWHLPFVSLYELSFNYSPSISAARAARVSYFMQEHFSPKDDLTRFDKLVSSTPHHYSPLEHPAMALESPQRCGNVTGFKQLRQFYEET